MLRTNPASRNHIVIVRNPAGTAWFALPAGCIRVAGKIAVTLAIGMIGGCAQVRAPLDAMEVPLTRVAGDAVRGGEVFIAREAGHCVLCHTVAGVPLAGNIGPSLQGVGKRLSASQLRLRVVDITRLNPDAVMPTFYRVTELNQVAKRYRGQPVISAQQVEDLVAYLETLK